MQTLVERGCGLDVHQASVVACLLIVLKNESCANSRLSISRQTGHFLKRDHQGYSASGLATGSRFLSISICPA